jgi:hypothetical protein
MQGDALRNEAATTPHLHLELHAIDLSDPAVDGLGVEVASRSRELSTPLDRRLERLVKLLEARGGGVPIGRAMGRHLR